MHFFLDCSQLAQYVDTVATSNPCRDLVVSVFVAEALVWLRHVVEETDVATARCCRDPLVLAVDVATA